MRYRNSSLPSLLSTHPSFSSATTFAINVIYPCFLQSGQEKYPIPTRDCNLLAPIAQGLPLGQEVEFTRIHLSDVGRNISKSRLMNSGCQMPDGTKIIEDQSASLCGSYGVTHGYYFLPSSGCFLQVPCDLFCSHPGWCGSMGCKDDRMIDHETITFEG